MTLKDFVLYPRFKMGFPLGNDSRTFAENSLSTNCSFGLEIVMLPDERSTVVTEYLKNLHNWINFVDE